MEKINPKYLIKIQAQKQYQDDLVNKGNLHTNCAKYYSDLYVQNPMQGDNKECSLWISSGKINTLNSIYSTIAIYEDDLIIDGNDNFINLQKDVLKDFSGNDCFVTIIKFDNFYKQLKLFSKCSNIKFENDKVGYCSKISKEFFAEHIENLNIFMFIKSKKYASQKEYRFVFEDNCKQVLKNIYLDGKFIPEEQSILSNDYYIGSINSFSQRIELNLENSSDNILIKLEI